MTSLARRTLICTKRVLLLAEYQITSLTWRSVEIREIKAEWFLKISQQGAPMLRIVLLSSRKTESNTMLITLDTIKVVTHRRIAAQSEARLLVMLENGIHLKFITTSTTITRTPHS
jgi:hypothetical protein